MSDRSAQADILLKQMPEIKRDEALQLLDAFGGSAEAVMRHLQNTAGAQTKNSPSRVHSSGHRRSDKKPERYFVGGGPSSGQAVLAGDDDDENDRHGAGRAVKALFEEIRQSGGDEAPEDGDGNERGPRAFFGSGRRLGHTTQPSPFVASTLRQTRTVIVEIYRNGYRIDNGQLQPPNNSAAVRFFRSLKEQVVPEAIAELYPATQITVKLLDYTNEDYTKPTRTAFAGEGHRLVATNTTNNPNTALTSDNVSATKEFEVHDGEEKSKLAIINLINERKEFVVNPKRHTVGDVFALAAQKAQPGAVSFKLLTRDVPPRPLVDKTLTIDAAKLRNATVMMRPIG